MSRPPRRPRISRPRRVPYRLRIPLAIVAGVAIVTGCLTPNARDAGSARPRERTDLYRLDTGEARSLAGCRYDYRVYEPVRGESAEREPPGDGGDESAGVRPTVMLGHGFLRDQDTLVDLARALANAGFRTTTLDFCNMRPWNGHHRRNAADLIALADTIGARDLVYAGFSAGALAALLAAVDDTRTRGVITLDLVDQADLAMNALARLDVPLIGLQGPPSACNADGSGQRVFDARPDAVLDTLAGTSHCEFESPTNGLCEIACGDDDPATDDARARRDVIRRVVDAVAALVP